MSARDSRDWSVVLCLFAVLFLGVADNQTLSPLLPAIRQTLGRSSREMGVLFTGYSLCAGLSVLLWGPLSDVFGRRKGLFWGFALFAAGSCVSFLSTGFGPLLAGRMITGTGASMLSLNTISYAADYFPYEKRGWAMGCIFSSYFAALILGVPAGSWIGSALGWNAVFALAGITAVALALATRRVLPALVTAVRRRGLLLILAGQARNYNQFVTSRSTFFALMSSFWASAGTTGFLAFLGVWLHDAFGIGSRQTGMVFLASGAAALLASPLAGSLSDRIGKRPQFVLSNVAFAALLLVLPWLSWGIKLLGVFCALSLSTAFRQGPMEALLTEVVPAVSRGSFVALKNAFSQAGIALSAFTSGLLFEASGYAAVCTFCALASAVSAVSISGVSRGRSL